MTKGLQYSKAAVAGNTTVLIPFNSNSNLLQEHTVTCVTQTGTSFKMFSIQGRQLKEDVGNWGQDKKFLRKNSKYVEVRNKRGKELDSRLCDEVYAMGQDSF